MFYMFWLVKSYDFTSQNAILITLVGLTWDPIWRSPLTRTKICMVGLTWDPNRRSPLTRTKICVVGLTWDPIQQSPLTRTKICVLPVDKVWTCFLRFLLLLLLLLKNFLMVGFLSFFFLMVRFDQTFHLMLSFFFYFCDFAGLTSILPNCRVDICPSWLLKLTRFFLMTRLENLVLPYCGVDLKTHHDNKVDLLISLRFSWQ